MLPRHLHWPHRIGSAGTKGAWQGVSGARRGLRHEAAVQEGEERQGKKGRGEFVGKAAGDKRLYTCRKAGRCPTPCRTRLAVRAVTGSLNQNAFAGEMSQLHSFGDCGTPQVMVLHRRPLTISAWDQWVLRRRRTHSSDNLVRNTPTGRIRLRI